ncbi:MAG: aminotransferase class I/II-fold pyridoxal phosphate-dependent enzyme [Bacteroidetes bacterium]|nr:aminotransferase class I/II-fold pyridoxal phosphate-dependent enzyme [Bacteroidota bacterium]
MDKRIWLSPPYVGDTEEQLLLEAFRSNWIAPAGPALEHFEQGLCHITGAPHAVALSSGTAALHLALALIGTGPGDEVIVPSFTYVATANPVRYCGATPVFVDCEPDSYCMSPHWLEVCIKDRLDKGKKPKAVILAHIYGQVADVPAILQLCNQYQILLIEDAAESLGARIGERMAGTFAPLGAYSFNGNKIITTGGGGALVSLHREPVEHGLYLATQAKAKRPFYFHKELGYNYRMSNLLAAVGLGQLTRLDDRIAIRRGIRHLYQDILTENPGVYFLPEPEGRFFTHWLSVAHFPEGTPGKLVDALEAENVESRRVWMPLHKMPLFNNCAYYGAHSDQQHFDTGLCLPSGEALSAPEQFRITQIIGQALTAQAEQA